MAALIGLSASSGIAADVPGKAVPPVASKGKAATQGAYAAFKNGDAVGAVAALQPTIKRGPSEPHEDLQLGRRLLLVSYMFKADGDAARSATVSTLALGKVALPTARMSAKDAAASLMLAGEIYEFRGESASARQAYQQALGLDPKLQHASQRLAQIAAIEAKAQEKQTANNLLRQRALAPKPKL